MSKNQKIVLPGGAGLVGQNLVARLIDHGFNHIIVIDKHKSNLETLKRIQPFIVTECADVSKPGPWQKHFDGADAVVMLQAQIGGPNYNDFLRNNVESTQVILNLIKEKNIKTLVHISSSVVDSVANDFYTNTKKEQEELVINSGIPCTVLRPTLMFGWFDRKHLGWLSRFMRRVPLFPIPGNGRFPRQPLYVGDFCEIIISCIEKKSPTGVFKISGREYVDYIDIIRVIRNSTQAKALITCIPYWMFYSLLWIWGLLDKNPPFTTQQLKALVAKDEFEIIDWPNIFQVNHTPFQQAVKETFCHPIFSKIELEF